MLVRAHAWVRPPAHADALMPALVVHTRAPDAGNVGRGCEVLDQGSVPACACACAPACGCACACPRACARVRAGVSACRRTARACVRACACARAGVPPCWRVRVGVLARACACVSACSACSACVCVRPCRRAARAYARCRVLARTPSGEHRHTRRVRTGSAAHVEVACESTYHALPDLRRRWRHTGACSPVGRRRANAHADARASDAGACSSTCASPHTHACDADGQCMRALPCVRATADVRARG